MVKIGLLDSGVDNRLHAQLTSARSFFLTAENEVQEQAAVVDPINHGSVIARIIRAGAPDAVIVNAQVFTHGQSTTPVTIAAGLAWLQEQKVDIVNMSFGLRQNRKALQDACAKALKHGLILVASAPARGPAVYPASYPGVIRVTGDARCDLKTFSFLDTTQADFGACPRSYEQPGQGAPVGGASFAVAHVVAALANHLAAGNPRQTAIEYLKTIALYHGPERRH